MAPLSIFAFREMRKYTLQNQFATAAKSNVPNDDAVLSIRPAACLLPPTNSTKCRFGVTPYPAPFKAPVFYGFCEDTHWCLKVTKKRSLTRCACFWKPKRPNPPPRRSGSMTMWMLDMGVLKRAGVSSVATLTGWKKAALGGAEDDCDDRRNVGWGRQSEYRPSFFH